MPEAIIVLPGAEVSQLTNYCSDESGLDQSSKETNYEGHKTSNYSADRDSDDIPI